MFLTPSPLLQGHTATRRPGSPSTPMNGAVQSSHTAPRPLLAVRRITLSVTEASAKTTGTDQQGRAVFPVHVLTISPTSATGFSGAGCRTHLLSRPCSLNVIGFKSSRPINTIWAGRLFLSSKSPPRGSKARSLGVRRSCVSVSAG